MFDSHMKMRRCGELTRLPRYDPRAAPNVAVLSLLELLHSALINPNA